MDAAGKGLHSPHSAKMRIVSLLVPIRSGVYQFHCNLLRGLNERGCSITWLCSGSALSRLIAANGAELSDGQVVAPNTDNMAERTGALVERIREISPDVLICHARGDPVDFNAIRYLPDSISKVLVLHGSTLAVYRAARAVRDYVNATVAISPRIRQDLISTYDFHEDRMKLIPHGIDVSAFFSRLSNESVTGPLRILSHGRIDKEQKGVFWLPEILVELACHSDEWKCTISGDGPDLEELKRRVARAGLSNRIRFTGWTASGDVPELMSRHDIFLFPTTYEGSPIALIEAMAGGCVPIASRLPGITDWIVQDGVNGLLFPIGNVRQAAEHLIGLLSDRRRLADLRQHAQESVSKYDLDWMAEQYYQLFCEVQSNLRPIRQAESLDECKLASGLKPAWWYGLPEPIKNRLRILREKIHTAVKVP
jgi:glycosyltransferase involved in cell wall biosynthesis